jgi:nicotinate-nucleotide pyrophosphorylase (carboxylating)
MSDGPEVHPPGLAVREAVARALAEDLLPMGDLTTSLVPADARGEGAFVARAHGVLAGRACVTETFAQVGHEVELRWALDDGDLLSPGRVLATAAGPLRQVLTAERTALNFACHLSGVATYTRRFVDAAAARNPATRVWDTRKTTPGLRALEKAAVRAGGGVNHRGSLSEGVLVKDNHLTGLGIAEAVARARSWWPGRMIEVECDRIDQVKEALVAGATLVLLDNMTPEQVAACASLVRAQSSVVLIEVSGGVTLETVGDFAAAGADLISAGVITHSAPAVDIGLDLDPGHASGAGPRVKGAGPARAGSGRGRRARGGD